MMSKRVGVELDDRTATTGQMYGLIEERNGSLCFTDTGTEALGNYLDREWAKMPVCPNCEQKKYLYEGDYVCRGCRYGSVA